MNEQQILQAAIDEYGIEQQLVKAVEELTELSLAIQHSFDGKSTLEEITEEIADVKIMLKQLEMILDCKEAVAEIKVQKLERLRKRILDE